MPFMVVIGLGNPGKKYAKTRHNFGARAVGAWFENHTDSEVLLPKAGVFMNDFGGLIKTLEVRPLRFLLVHDDIELPFGEIKFQSGGSAKGHNGVRSVHNALGTTDVPRLRLGVGRPGAEVEVNEFVLDIFTEEEEEKLGEVIERAGNYLTQLAGRAG